MNQGIALNLTTATNNISISFNNFLVPFCVLKELNIINVDNSSLAFVYRINSHIKTDLSKSKIYNSLNLIKKTLKI